MQKPGASVFPLPILPAMLETFLPSADEVKRLEDEKKAKKGAKGKPAADKPQMVGPTGHQKP